MNNDQLRKGLEQKLIEDVQSLFFNIEHPDRYIRYYKNKHIKSIV